MESSQRTSSYLLRGSRIGTPGVIAAWKVDFGVLRPAGALTRCVDYRADITENIEENGYPRRIERVLRDVPYPVDLGFPNLVRPLIARRWRQSTRDHYSEIVALDSGHPPHRHGYKRD